MTRWMTKLAAVTTAVALGISGAAQAQSAYGCENLDGFHSLPSLEGLDGVFFRVNPDLRNFHPFSDETVQDLARLSREFSQKGTTLVYAPIPPKSMVLTGHLPGRAYDYGFDPQLAASVYDDMIRRLREAGVVVADVRRALAQGANSGRLPYFRTDYRLNSTGAQLVAQAVSQAMNGGAMPLAQAPQFSTGNQMSPVFQQAGLTQSTVGQREVDSDMRRKLQRHCLIELPRVMTDVVEGAPTQTSGASGFGGGLVLVGTSYSATPEIGFAGQLQRATGMTVTQVSLEDGAAYDGFLSYLSSGAMQQNRPRVIVWENPVYSNLAQFGDQPMRELIAAAGDTCRISVPVMAALDANTATADLSGLDPSVQYTLYLEADGAAASEAQFTFLSPRGQQLTKTVVRRNNALRNGRFYMPMTGLWAEGVRQVDIRLDTPVNGGLRLAACTY